MSFLLSVVRRVRRCTWTELVLLGLALLAVVGMWGGLRLSSFRRLVRWTGTVPNRPFRVGGPVIDRIVWATRTVSRCLFPDGPCLPQALAARFLLARCGVATDLCIGVARESDENLYAHAWLEREGQVLVGGSEAPVRYHPLAETIDQS